MILSRASRCAPKRTFRSARSRNMISFEIHVSARSSATFVASPATELASSFEARFSTPFVATLDARARSLRSCSRIRIALRSRTLDLFPFRGSGLGAVRTRVVLATEPAHAPLSRIMYGNDRMPRMLRPQSRHALFRARVPIAIRTYPPRFREGTLTSATSIPSSFESDTAARSYASDAYEAPRRAPLIEVPVAAFVRTRC